MKTSVLRKSVLTVASLLTFSSLSVLANDDDFSRAQKELKIMSKIFETSLGEQASGPVKVFGSKRPEAMYLAKQGMVFSFNFGRNSFVTADDWEQFGEGIGQFVGVIASEVTNALAELPVAPEAPEAPEFAFEYEDQFQAYQEKMEALEAMREQQREQREQVRELQREIRSLERESEREEEKTDRLESIKKELDEKLARLDKKMADYNESMRKYRETRDKKYHQSAKLKSDIILSTLCDYGATLRSLESGEHFTLIFENYVAGKDQIYVFNSSDVKRCESTDKLLERAISYQL